MKKGNGLIVIVPRKNRKKEKDSARGQKRVEGKTVKVVKQKERKRKDIEKEKWMMLSHEEEREGMYKMPDTV